MVKIFPFIFILLWSSAFITTKPIIFDGDNGGKIEHLSYLIKSLERSGVSAIVIEDKKGLKKRAKKGHFSRFSKPAS